MQLQALQGELTSDPVGVGGFRALVSKDGHLWAHPDKSEMQFDGVNPPSFAANPLWRSRAPAGRAGFAQFERAGVPQLGAIAMVGDVHAVAALPIDEVLADAMGERAVLLAMLAVSVLIAGFCSFVAWKTPPSEAARSA